jgi:hypothetical protein
MIPDQLNNSELDSLVRHVLTVDDKFALPSGLSEKTIRKLERRMLLRELLIEFSLKAGLVIGSLAILAGVFVLINGRSVIETLYARFSDNRQIIAPLFFVALITILVDQVGLRFYNRYHQEAV